jgi:hypothetical protein
VGRHDDEHLRRFLAARQDGDAVEMRRCWEELVISVYDRMDNIIAATHRAGSTTTSTTSPCSSRSSASRPGSSTRSRGRRWGSSSTRPRPSRAASASTCSAGRSGSARATRSLDAGWEADAAERASTAWEADEARARFERDEQDADADAFLRWALPQLRGRRRDVVERTFYGAELHEICDELGLTPDNAYQLRSRGLKDLAKLKEAYES